MFFYLFFSLYLDRYSSNVTVSSFLSHRADFTRTWKVIHICFGFCVTALCDCFIKVSVFSLFGLCKSYVVIQSAVKPKPNVSLSHVSQWVTFTFPNGSCQLHIVQSFTGSPDCLLICLRNINVFKLIPFGIQSRTVHMKIQLQVSSKMFKIN